MNPAPTTPVLRLEVGLRPGHRDPRGEDVTARARRHLGLALTGVRTRDVYHLVAGVTPDEAALLAAALPDPVTQEAALGRLPPETCDVVIAVGLRPGVADPVGISARAAFEDLLGRPLGPGAAVHSSTLHLVSGTDLAGGRRLAEELLANPLIQGIEVVEAAVWAAADPSLEVPAVDRGARPPVQRIDLELDDPALERLSREGLLALNLREMHAIRDHFRRAASHPRREAAGLGAAPTDVELECLAQTWSEHCKHKIFNAAIDFEDAGGARRHISSLFATTIRGTTEELDRRFRERDGESWLVSVFHDNAGVVTFDEEIHLVYKVETHNSPSALDPYGGAITGIVGVNRDPFGTGRGADLRVNVWGYCFAPPEHEGPLPPGLLHPRRIREGVHRGVIDGGNQSGIPYGRGWELFDGRYLGKPLVFCGTVGTLPVSIAGRPGEDKEARPGDRIVMVGGRIGADGIHGATFSSAALDESSPSQAVQIGDPITQRRMFDFLLEARDRGLYSSLTDNGAGGLSSSVGEMARQPGGAWLDLARAPLKYPGLAAWEVFLSEAQERMTVAVPPEHLQEFLELAARREVEATDLGAFTSDGVLEVRWGEEIVGLLDLVVLLEGLPRLELRASWSPPPPAPGDEPPQRAEDLAAAWLELAASPNLRFEEDLARHYDHEVQGLTAVKPWVGAGRDVPADATVFLARHGSTRGFVLSEGVHPWLSELDPAAMARWCLDEAVRRQLAAGARLDRIAALDNFCWPDPILSPGTPDGDRKLGQLVLACEGLAAACLAYEVPLISGKDSMKNEAVVGGVKIAVPPTLLVSAIGQIEDVRRARSLDWKAAGDVLFLLGTSGPHTGASEYYRWLGRRQASLSAPGAAAPYRGTRPPEVPVQELADFYRALAPALDLPGIRAIGVLGRGGLALALARAAVGGRLGADIDLAGAAGMDGLAGDEALFAESAGRLLVAVSPEAADGFAAALAGRPCARIGTVEDSARLRVRHAGAILAELALPELAAACGARARLESTEASR